MGSLVSLVSLPAYAEVTSLQTTSSFYKGGSTIYFSGTVLASDPPNVTILVFDPTNKFILLASGNADNNHQFQISVDTSTSDNQQKFTLKGTYNATAFIATKENGKTVNFVFSPDGSMISSPIPSQNNEQNTISQSSPSLDKLLKQRLQDAQVIQKLRYPQNMSSSTPISIGKNNVAVISTKYGAIAILLNPNTPQTVANFQKLANSGFYDKTVFHRIVPGFVIQGGDPNTINGDRSTWGLGNAGYTIPPEFSSSLNFTKYTVGMARGSDVNSGSSQFFITVGNTAWLNNQYTLFGEVISGQDIVDKIASLQTNSNSQPVNPEDARIRTIAISSYSSTQPVNSGNTLDNNSSSQTTAEIIKAIQQKQEEDRKEQEAAKQEQLKIQQQLQLQKQEESRQEQLKLQQQILHDQTVGDKTRKIISSRDEFFNANDDVHTLIFKGNAFLMTGKYVDAFNYFNKALSKDPQNSDAQDGKNKAYTQIHQLVSNIVDIDENTDNSNNPDSIASKGVQLAQLQNFDDSLSTCSSALQLSPENHNAMACKLAALAELGKYDDMNKVLQNSSSSSVDLQVIYRIFTLYHLEKYDELESYVNTIGSLALSSNPYSYQNSYSYGFAYNSYSNPTAILGFTAIKAMIAEKAGKTDLANSYYSIVIPSSGQDANALKGSLFFTLKDYDKAIFYLEKAPYSQSVGYLKVITYDEIARGSAAYKIQNTLEQVQKADENKHKFCFLFWCF